MIAAISFSCSRGLSPSMPFPRDQIASYAAALNPIPARLLLERRNVAGSQLRVVDFSKFRGKPVLVLTGTNDLGHARAVDEPIADWLNANGAQADFIYSATSVSPATATC